MGGLGRHYSNTERKVVRGHGLLSGLYVLLGQRCPLEPRVYCQRQVCEAEGHPFCSKIDLVEAGIEQFAPVAGTHTHVLADSWYTVARSVGQRSTGAGTSVAGSRAIGSCAERSRKARRNGSSSPPTPPP